MLRTHGARWRLVHPRSVALAGLLFLGLWFVPSVASAHAVLVRTTPSGTVPTTPDVVRLDFDEPPRTQFSVVHVTGPDGVRRDSGPVAVQGSAVVESLTGASPAGLYTVDWRVVSDDGHPVSGQWRFTATAAADLAAAPAPPAPSRNATNNGGAHLAHAGFAVAVAALLGLSLLGERWWKARKRVRPT
ncbi:MAG TPA: copper resistance CopC family protein [Frankiaceae bacterium]|nr:copper resistance CopC family protein [Frankiaceae bacterium]